MSTEKLLNLFQTAKKLEQSDRKAAENKYTELITSADKFKVDEKNLNHYLASAYNNRGYLKYLAVDFDAASEDYTLCINVDPKFTVAYYNRGMIHYRLGRFDEAIKDLNHTLMLDSSFKQAKIGLEKCMQDKKERIERQSAGFYDS